MEIIRVPINTKEIVRKYMSHFKTMTKVVVDIKREISAEIECPEIRKKIGIVIEKLVRL